MTKRNSVFSVDRWRAVELVETDLPELQAFFEANPPYFVTVNGQPAEPGEAREEFDIRPPDDWSYRKKWFLGIRDADGDLVGMADVIEDLLADHIWHIGTFIVATALHGTGAAHRIYGGLEAWMRAGGAAWCRLGVVFGHARAERFWERIGYFEVNRRDGIVVKSKTHVVRVMAKPFAGGDLADYYARVPRDRRTDA